MNGAAMVVDGGLTATGANTIRALGQGQGMTLAVGVDRGSTGLDSSAKLVEG